MTYRWLGATAAALLALACSAARTTSTLAYAGDAEATIPALEAEIAAEGFKPICKEEAFCRFDLDETLRVHSAEGGCSEENDSCTLQEKPPKAPLAL